MRGQQIKPIVSPATSHSSRGGFQGWHEVELWRASGRASATVIATMVRAHARKLVTLDHSTKREVCKRKVENPSMTNRELAQWVQDTFDQKVHDATISGGEGRRGEEM
jgi:hypothetical protein